MTNKGLDRMLDDMAKIPLPDPCVICGQHFCEHRQVEEPEEFDPFGDPDGNPIPGFNIQG